MLNATSEELIDLSDYLYEVAARLRIAASLQPASHPQESVLRENMRAAALHLCDAAAVRNSLPIRTAEEAINELYSAPKPGVG